MGSLRQNGGHGALQKQRELHLPVSAKLCCAYMSTHLGYVGYVDAKKCFIENILALFASQMHAQRETTRLHFENDMPFKGIQKRKMISVITHLSDDVGQTLCKILFLSKSGLKVWYFFFTLASAGAQIIRQPVHDSSASDIGQSGLHTHTPSWTTSNQIPSKHYMSRLKDWISRPLDNGQSNSFSLLG